MFGNSIHHALIHAATRYDERRAGRRFYNHYALPQYFKRIEEVEQDIAAGALPRDALIAAFSDRLLDCLLKAIDQPPHAPRSPTK